MVRARVYKIKVCQRCGKEYKPMNSTQKYCPECRPIVYKEETTMWVKANPERARANVMNWAKRNPEKARYGIKQWELANSDKVKGIQRKMKAKRRALGFIPLNTPFPECDGHHVDKEHVVYVPHILHISVPHNIWTGRNMAEINAAVDNWLTEDRT